MSVKVILWFAELCVALISGLWSWRLIWLDCFRSKSQDGRPWRSRWLQPGRLWSLRDLSHAVLSSPQGWLCDDQGDKGTKKSLFCHSSIFTTTLNTILKQREHKVWDIDFKIYTCNYFLYFCLLHKWRVSIKKSFKRNIQQTAGIVLVSPSPVKIKWNLIQISAIFYSHIYTKTITQLITILDLTQCVCQLYH